MTRYDDDSCRDFFRPKISSSPVAVLHVPSSQKIALVMVAFVLMVATPPMDAQIFSIEGQTCNCMLFSLCEDNNTVGVTNPCPGIYDTCCKQPANTIEPTITPYLYTPVMCGHSNKDVAKRIAGNDAAEVAEFPWMVAILKEDPLNSSSKIHFCGASLIHPSVVLTAFHCLKGKEPSEIVIRAGEWDFGENNSMFPVQDRRVSKIVKHENYFSSLLYNDVALIFVTEPFVMSYHLAAICLPPQGFEFNEQRCLSSGWGKDGTGIDATQQKTTLKKVELPIVPREPCFNLLKLTNKMSPYLTSLHDSFLCAGGEIGRDTCQGDGGSPLMCLITPSSENQQYHQAGIVSWGIGCGNKTPGVYVDVAKFRDWIDQKMIQNGLDTSYYEAFRVEGKFSAPKSE